MADDTTVIAGVPITRHWLIPQANRPKVYTPHPLMSAEEIRARTQGVWDSFYSWSNVWARSNCVESLKARVAFVLISKLYRQMYANTGIATDSARVQRSARWARWIGYACRRLFLGKPMPHLAIPGEQLGAVGATHCQAVPTALRRQAYAGIDAAGLAALRPNLRPPR